MRWSTAQESSFHFSSWKKDVCVVDVSVRFIGVVVVYDVFLSLPLHDEEASA